MVPAIVAPSDSYGQIPNLRATVDSKEIFLPIKRELSKADRVSVSPSKDGLLSSWDNFSSRKRLSSAKGASTGAPNAQSTGFIIRKKPRKKRGFKQGPPLAQTVEEPFYRSAEPALADAGKEVIAE